MSKLLIDDQPVMVLPRLAQAIGLNEAVVLQQIHYWLKTYQEANKSGHFHDGAWWVYNTKKEWQENFPWWSENTVWRALTALRERGLVLVTGEYNKKSYDKTLWYTIDYDRLNELEKDLVPKMVKAYTQNGKMDLTKLGTPIPETIAETSFKELKLTGDLFHDCQAIYETKKGRLLSDIQGFAQMISNFEANGVTAKDYAAAIDAMDADPKYKGSRPTSYEKWAIGYAEKRNNPIRPGGKKRETLEEMEARLLHPNSMEAK